jgi:hypothetical protein
MTGDEVRQVFQDMLPQEEIDGLCQQFGVIERQRKLHLGMFVRAMVISAGTPGGAYQADVLRSYLECEVPSRFHPIRSFQGFRGLFSRRGDRQAINRARGVAQGAKRRETDDREGDSVGSRQWARAGGAVGRGWDESRGADGPARPGHLGDPFYGRADVL